MMPKQEREVLEDEFGQEAQNWDKVCQIKGYRCSRCGEFPFKEDWHVYKKTGMCGLCSHRWEQLQDE
jgi:hypothetical protein